MPLKPWYKIEAITPREDLREGRPLDASEFAVHLDHVRDKTAPPDYREPDRFFERTYMTNNLTDLAAQVVRRLSGITVETSAVFNMATQFGGGKTHALTLLYHVAQAGSKADKWRGVSKILERAQVSSVPKAATAAFVGTEFDSIKGRGGDDGTPLRYTPWGEIAWQLGKEKSFAAVARHDEERVAPAGDVIRAFLPKGPCLILIDELVNFLSRNRKSGLGAQLYDFLQNLSETARGRDNVVLAVSIPSLMDEMTADDFADFNRFKKMLDRLGKAVMMSAETETAEIIRRRLFEWQGLPDEAKKTASAYAEWVIDNKQMIGDFDVDQARETFLACYPFHPSVLSVFERKWSALPRFQKTRGILRLLALWVSRAYLDGYKGAHKDPLIGLGTAPLEDPYFRSAVFEQLGSDALETAVTTDIAGKKDANALRLDREASEAIKKARLHKKVATAIFFESNGGMTSNTATLPEIRLAVAEPDIDIANVEGVLESLAEGCYYLAPDRNRYRFTSNPRLNKVLADRRGSIKDSEIEDRIKQEVQNVFKAEPGMIERNYFPEQSGQVPDRAVLTLVVCKPEQIYAEPATLRFIEKIVRECGSTGRTFKSALLFAVPDNPASLQDEARRLLALEDINEDDETLKRLDESDRRQLETNIKKSTRDLKEAVWRTYRYVVLLGKDNKLREVDLGLVNSSQADSMKTVIVERLRKDGEVEKDISPNMLIRNWPAFKEWSTKSVRDAFFASPQLPRLLDGETIRDTIARGVSNEVLGYVGKATDGKYEPFVFGSELIASDVEFSDDMFIITKATAEDYHKASASPKQGAVPAEGAGVKAEGAGSATPAPYEPSITEEDTSKAEKPPSGVVKGLVWQGEIPPQKWMNFYTKVLSKFAGEKTLKLTLKVQVSPDGGVSPQKIEETKVALRELNLKDDMQTD
jgi:hypothetical protein